MKFSSIPFRFGWFFLAHKGISMHNHDSEDVLLFEQKNVKIERYSREVMYVSF